MGQTLLEAIGLSYSAAEVRLVADVSLRVSAGEVVCLVGPNGAGKSTLLRLLAGELRPERGQVLVDGRPLDAYAARDLALRRAVMPQQTVLQFAFAARDVVLMGRNPHIGSGWPGPDDFEVAARCMEQTETAALATRPFPSLSGGEQTRVTLARVLAQAAPLLLLDEPSASLDIRHQEQVMRISRELAERGAGLLVVLHDLNLASAYADRVALMHGGALVADGCPEQVLQPSLLSQVFDYPITVLRNVGASHPIVLPDRRSARHALDPVAGWVAKLGTAEAGHV